ncbi:30S ribosomal protein S20 [Candidatus Parcubacteria bacterium]|nr:30S ribosomal protein S20 [Candidatus Parcubacteria bacterium]
MPIIKSAQKRVRKAKKASILNSRTKRTLKGTIKAFQKSTAAGKKSDKALKSAQSAIDTAVKKGVIHKNKAARQKSRLAKSAKK